LPIGDLIITLEVSFCIALGMRGVFKLYLVATLASKHCCVQMHLVPSIGSEN
jgi:hypothetical protein